MNGTLQSGIYWRSSWKFHSDITKYRLYYIYFSLEELPHMPGMGGSDGISSDDCKTKLAKAFGQKTRDEWAQIFDGSDACVTPIMELSEAMEHTHNKERQSFVKDVDGDFSPVL